MTFYLFIIIIFVYKYFLQKRTYSLIISILVGNIFKMFIGKYLNESIFFINIVEVTQKVVLGHELRIELRVANE